MKKSSYKANIAGPSCQQRPCKMIPDPNNLGEWVVDVKFDPDPIWDGQWPPCIFGNFIIHMEQQDYLIGLNLILVL